MSRDLTPLNVDCPRCGAKAGWGCEKLDGSYRATFHAERRAAALAKADTETEK